MLVAYSFAQDDTFLEIIYTKWKTFSTNPNE